MAQDPHARPLRSAEFRFYEELNDFLPPERRKVSFMQRFGGSPSARDVIQAIGVPHTAIDLLLVDGRSVAFSHRLQGGERVAVYPVFERLDIRPLLRLRPRPLRDPKFILDVHLGRLARYLRMLGFDCSYRNDWDDARLIESALGERRVILTRDVGILKQSRVTHGYWLRATDAEEQLHEVIEALDLWARVEPFTRCIECNGALFLLDPASTSGLVEPEIQARFDRFWQCQDCRKVYWRGTHYERMLRKVRRAAARFGHPPGAPEP